jgi:putative Mg2+ transporter-C (MgtC) family protein
MSSLDVHLWSASTPTELVLLVVAFVLCLVIGVERELARKSAGIRTHVLVGTGACGFTLVSAYGFSPPPGAEVLLDPSRIAAQIVSGIGFLGAGVIFMRRDVVRGLTTAATIWLTAAVGMAAGAGMVLLAVAMTVLHLVATSALGVLGRHLPDRHSGTTTTIRYADGRGVLRSVLAVAAEMGFETVVMTTRRDTAADEAMIVAQARFRGRAPLEELVANLSELPGVHAVRAGASGGER